MTIDNPRQNTVNPMAEDFFHEIEFKPTVHDLTNARRLSYRKTQKSIFFWSISASLFVIFLMWAFGERVNIFDVITFLTIGFFIPAMIYPLHQAFLAPHLARKSFRIQKSLHQVSVIRWNSDYIEFESQRGKIRDSLTEIVCWSSDNETLIIGRGLNMYQFLPSRAFVKTDSRQSLIDALVAAGVKEKWPPK